MSPPLHRRLPHRLLRLATRKPSWRFVLDFWLAPRTALRRYRRRRTWPNANELDRMSPEQFERYMRTVFGS